MQVSAAQLLESLPAAIYATDAQGRVTMFNRAAAALWGREPRLNEDLWCGSWKIFNPDGTELPLDRCPMAVTLREGRSVTGQEILVERPDGTRRNVLPHPQVVRSADGTIIGATNLLTDITAQRRTEDALYSSADRTRAIIESEPECVKVVAPDGTVLEMNPAGLRMVEAETASEVIGVCVYDLVLPETLGTFRGLHDAALRGETSTGQYRIRGLKGTERWMESTSTPLRDTAGGITAVLSVTRDVTNLRRHERALLEQARALETINRVGAQLGAELNLEKLIQAVTDAGRELTGAEFGAFFYNHTDEKGDSYTLYTLSGAPREAFAKFPMPRKTAVFGPTFDGTAVVRSDDITKDPRYGKNAPHKGMPAGHLPVRSYLAVPVVSRSGDVLGGLFYGHSKTGVFTDQSEKLLVGITAQATVALDNAKLFQTAQRELVERTRAEEELRRSEQHWRHLADAMPQMVFAARPDGYTDYYNKQWYELTRSDPKLGGDESFIHFIHPEDRQRCLDTWYESIRTGEIYQIEYRFRFPGWDSYRWHLGRALPVFDEGGTIVRWFGTCTDIHDVKSAEQQLAQHNERLNEAVTQAQFQLEQSNQARRLAERMAALGTMAAGLGHDIGNLLLPLRARLDSIRARHGSPEDLEDLAAINRSADYFASLVRGLRMFARGDSAEDAEGVTDLERWCQDARPFLSGLVGKQIGLEIVVDQSVPHAAVAASVLTQSVVNLIKNAADAIGKGSTGKIQLLLSLRGEQPCLSVRDNGTGMSSEVLSRCTEPYFTTKGRGHETGTGLGLALVHQSITQRGGRVEIESAAGHGTTVSLVLPRAASGGGAQGSRGKASLSISDRRLSAIAMALLNAAGFAPEDCKGGPTNDSELWVTDRADGDAISAFLRAHGSRRAVALCEAAFKIDESVRGRITHLGSKPTASDLRSAFADWRVT